MLEIFKIQILGSYDSTLDLDSSKYERKYVSTHVRTRTMGLSSTISFYILCFFFMSTVGGYWYVGYACCTIVRDEGSQNVGR